MTNKIRFLLLLIFLFSACGGRRPDLPIPDKTIYWNPQAPLLLPVNNSRPLENIRAFILNNRNKIPLETKILKPFTSYPQVQVTQTNSCPANLPMSLLLETTPAGSKDALLLDRYPLVIDADPPLVLNIRTSPSIVRGGSALVLFDIVESNLDKLYCLDNEGSRFFPETFISNGQYICLTAWPVYDDDFSLRIVAVDKAGNSTTNQVRLLKREKEFPHSKLAIGTYFNADKIAEVTAGITNIPQSAQKQYDMVMQGFRDKKTIDIVETTSQPVKATVSKISWRPFISFPGARVTSGFGSHRFYMLKHKQMRDSYHLGLDLAKHAESPVYAPNDGEVIYTGYNGANGNMVLIHHGLGLYTLYAHSSKIFLQKGDLVKAGQKISLTGQTGYALGDHLHYSVIIQGRYVNPEEWMSGEWLWENVLNICRSKTQKHSR